MSIPAVNWALSQRTGSSSKKAVLKCIAEWMIGERAVDCYPTVEQIAFETELNRQTVMEATRELAKAGLITKRRVCKNLRWETHYSFVGYVPEEWIGSRRPEVRAAKQPDVRNAEGTGNRTPGKATLDGVGNRTIKGVKTNTHEGTENRTRTWIDMEDKESTRISMRTSGNSSAIAAVASAQAQTPYPDDFDKSLFEEAEREARSFPEPLPEPPALPPIEPPAPAPQKRKAAPRRRPATPCPFDADASIPDEYKAIAEKVGIGNPQQVFSAFVNHALAHDRRLVIWPAGFRTWCSNELKWHPDQKPKPKPLHQRTADDYDW